MKTIAELVADDIKAWDWLVACSKRNPSGNFSIPLVIQAHMYVEAHQALLEAQAKNDSEKQIKI